MSSRHRLAVHMVPSFKVFVAATLLAVACRVADQAGPNSDITQLSITPDSIAVVAGQTVQFQAVGKTATGSTRSVNVTWSATGGTIDANGLYTADVNPGAFDVTATLQGSTVNGQARVHNHGALKQVVLLPATASVAPGGTVQFSSYGKMANGDSVPVNATYDATGGTIDQNGLFTAGSSPGSFAVTATVPINQQGGGTSTATAQVTITNGTPIPVASVTVNPNPATVTVGATVQLTATLKDANNSILTGRVITWSSNNTGVATVDGNGLVSGQAAGTATITATSEAKSGTSSLTVTAAPPQPVSTVTVNPNPATVAVGATVQLTATLKDANNSILTGRVVTWGSNNTSVATVDGNGLVSGQAAGSATITATSETKSGTSAVTVTGGSGGGSVVFVGAGDISDCSNNGDESTATLLDGISGTVFTLGDNVYPDGTLTQFQQCYDPTWGRHKARTQPAPGNHDYNTSGAAGYFGYFGALAGPSGRGYYSFDLGNWHIISLDSEISMSAGSAQETWLRADLAASTKQCTLAYWHKPRFSSGTNHGSLAAAQPLWQALYDFGAELVLNGHEHNYERFAPQTPTGAADPVKGIREIVSGTGGESHYNDEGTPLPNSEVFNGTTFGVLKLTLGAGTYSWQFIPVAGASFTDSGSGTCH